MIQPMDRKWIEQNKWRNRRMTALYLWDKRYLPGHPQHSLYTGLKQLYEQRTRGLDKPRR